MQQDDLARSGRGPNSEKQTAPVAWAEFSDSGRIRIWAPDAPPNVRAVPLYTHPASSAAASWRRASEPGETL